MLFPCSVFPVNLGLIITNVIYIYIYIYIYDEFFSYTSRELKDANVVSSLECILCRRKYLDVPRKFSMVLFVRVLFQIPSSFYFKPFRWLILSIYHTFSWFFSIRKHAPITWNISSFTWIIFWGEMRNLLKRNILKIYELQQKYLNFLWEMRCIHRYYNFATWLYSFFLIDIRYMSFIILSSVYFCIFVNI